AYVACPKNQKAIYSKLIYDEIRSMNPPGRFLKQDPNTKLWSDIGEKKALDKTRQALREGAPELLKEIKGEDDKSENMDAVGPLRVQRQNNPLTNSLMGNISLGSFSLNSLDNQRNLEAMGTPPLPGQIQMNNPTAGLTQEGANAILAAAAQIHQQQQQQQLLQQQAGSITPAQLQLLQNHLQMNQQQSQAPANPFNNVASAGSMFNMGNTGGYDAALAAAQASSNLGSEQVAALLQAIHNQASNNSATDMLQQQLTQQLITQNLLNQLNSSNSTLQAGNLGNQSVQHGFNTLHLSAQHQDSTVPSNVPTGASPAADTSKARAERIGMKNTQQRRPNRHLKNADQSLITNSLMSVESIDVDKLRMSGVSLGEFTGSEMSKLFESDRNVGKATKADDMSEVSDAMSDDSMSEDGKKG
ncbi:hypothetical protein ACHAWC_001238, partial [Mediolabrus comicus]